AELLFRDRRQDDLDPRQPQHPPRRRADLRLPHHRGADDPLSLPSGLSEQDLNGIFFPPRSSGMLAPSPHIARSARERNGASRIASGVQRAGVWGEAPSEDGPMERKKASDFPQELL